MKGLKGILVSFLVLVAVSFAQAKIIHVPMDYPTIQQGIDAAVDGDIVLVADGTYTGAGNRDIDFKGKAITVKSENGPKVTIIDCQRSGRGFYFGSNETSASVLSGFTITNGEVGGFEDGGGIYVSSSPIIENNIIKGNRVTSFHGGGIFCGRSPVIRNNIIEGNSSGWGGGIYLAGGSPKLINNTIIKNSASFGSGINHSSGTPKVVNTILWSNGIYPSSSNIDITYSDIQGGWAGVGNINSDPLFVDSDKGDYRLKDNSICIGAGTITAEMSATDIEGNPRPNPPGSYPDMGAYENPSAGMTGPLLVISPTSLTFDETTSEGLFTISNEGVGSLSWNITSDLPGWLKASPMSGETPYAGKSTVSLTIDRFCLKQGTYTHTISVTSNGGNGSVSIEMKAPEPDPLLSLSTTFIDFGSTTTEASFSISNECGNILSWNITDDLPGWLKASPMSGQTPAEGTSSVSLSVIREKSSGTYIHNMSVTSNGGNGNVAVRMVVAGESPSLSLSPTALDFGTANTQKSFTVTNIGGGTLNWEVTSQQPGWITSVSPASGSVSSGSGATVLVTVSRNAMTPGTHTHNISIGSDGGTGNVLVAMAVELAAVTDLSAKPGEAGKTIKLEWTAPVPGVITEYVIKYNNTAITESNWSESTDVDGEPVPGSAGTAESMNVMMPCSGVIYHFALKTKYLTTTSPISNSPRARSPIQLYTGWNLVSFAPYKIMQLNDAISSIVDKVRAIWAYIYTPETSTFTWLKYLKVAPEVSDLTQMEPGYGYWIKVSQNCVWDFGGSISMSPSELVMRKPPFLLYGKIHEWVYGSMDIPAFSISVKVKDAEAGSYTLGSNPRYGDYYVLEIPVDEPFYEGEMGRIYMNGREADMGPIRLGESGDVMRCDISYIHTPIETKVFQNYPNPFNPETWIPYQLKEDANVVIRIYTMTGQPVRILDLGHKHAGFYTNKAKAAYWDGRNETGERVASGIYFYIMKAGNFTSTHKMVIMR